MVQKTQDDVDSSPQSRNRGAVAVVSAILYQLNVVVAEFAPEPRLGHAQRACVVPALPRVSDIVHKFCQPYQEAKIKGLRGRCGIAFKAESKACWCGSC